MDKTVALEEDGIALDAGQGVAEAAAKVEVGGVGAAFAAVPISGACDRRLELAGGPAMRQQPHLPRGFSRMA